VEIFVIFIKKCYYYFVPHTSGRSMEMTTKKDILKKITSFREFFEDAIIKKKFKNETSSLLYERHVISNYASCVFCKHLYRSSCHSFCFSCMKNSYTECGPLLPATLTFYRPSCAPDEIEITPWIFKDTCSDFKRIEKKHYFKNFVSARPFSEVANIENLEGIFLGIVHDQRPCHICASVNISIFKKCSAKGQAYLKSPCTNILEELLNEYSSRHK